MKVKKVISYVLVLILIVTCALSIYITVVNKTLLSEQYVTAKLDKVNYYDTLYNEVQDNFSEYIMQSGLDKNVLDNIITKDMIKEDANNIIHNVYTGEKISIDTIKVKTNLDNNINNYLNSNNIKISNSEKTNITKFEDTISNVYGEQVGYSKYTKYIEKTITYMPKVEKIANGAMIGMYIFDLFVVMILIIINKKNIGRAFNYIAIVLFGSTCAMVLPKVYIANKLNIDTLQIFNKSFSDLVTNTIDSILNTFIVIGVVLFIIGLIISIWYAICGKSKKDEQ